MLSFSLIGCTVICILIVHNHEMKSESASYISRKDLLMKWFASIVNQVSTY